MTGIFEVDAEGLAAVMSRRGGYLHLILELIQNAWDERGVKRVDVNLKRDGEVVVVTVADDAPKGFANLADAYTLFARSTKVNNPEQRGMFNLGEKLVIAACKGGAMITTTTGRVTFDLENNTRHEDDTRTEKGSVFVGRIPMDEEDQEEIELELQALLPPKKIKTLVNGVEVEYRKPKKVLKLKALPVVVWDDDKGGLKELRRNTTVDVHAPLPDEVPSLYVMGLPVVELPGGDKWHLDVGHRIPVDLERQSVRPGILKQIRAVVLNELVDEVEESDVNSTWVLESLGAKETEPEAVSKFLKKKFGDKLATHTPSDPEASKRFVAAGGTVIYGNQLGKDVWKKVRENDLLEAAAVLTPSHRVNVSPMGPDVTVPRNRWTKGQRVICAYTEIVGEALLGKRVQAKVVNDPKGNYAACYGTDLHRVSYNQARLGKRWFTCDPRSNTVNELLIHELAHEKVSDHLSDDFHHECCRLGAKLARLALDRPEIWAEDAAWRKAAEGES